MKQTTILLVIYVIVIVAVVLFLWKFRTRGFSRRVLSDTGRCPFGKQTYSILSRQGARASREGIVSFSLYGKFDRYWPSLRNQLKDIPHQLPTWQCVVHVPIDVPGEVRDEVLELGAELVILKGNDTISGEILGHEGALWRFIPAQQTLPFITLDADDDFDPKLPNRIQKWLKSGRQFFIFSPINAWIPMMAGRWGARGMPREQAEERFDLRNEEDLEPPVPDMLERMNSYCENWFGFDEAFLKKEIWPLAKRNHYRTMHWPLTDLLVLALIVLFIGGVIALVASRNKDKELAVCLAAK